MYLILSSFIPLKIRNNIANVSKISLLKSTEPDIPSLLIKCMSVTNAILVRKWQYVL